VIDVAIIPLTDVDTGTHIALHVALPVGPPENRPGDLAGSIIVKPPVEDEGRKSIGGGPGGELVKIVVNVFWGGTSDPKRENKRVQDPDRGLNLKTD